MSMRRLRSRKNFGFTLIELMIVVIIVGILMVIGYPSYQQQMIRSHREAAEGELVQLASIQEKIYLNSNAYSASITAAYNGQAGGGLGKTTGTTDDGRYILTVVTPAGGAFYTITATPVAGSSQAADGNLSISADGQRLWGPTNKAW